MTTDRLLGYLQIDSDYLVSTGTGDALVRGRYVSPNGEIISDYWTGPITDHYDNHDGTLTIRTRLGRYILLHSGAPLV